MSAYPNAFFDLCGMCCGHFNMPFWTFFGAVFIGKALIKVWFLFLSLICDTKLMLLFVRHLDKRASLWCCSAIDIWIRSSYYSIDWYPMQSIRIYSKTKIVAVSTISKYNKLRCLRFVGRNCEVIVGELLHDARARFHKVKTEIIIFVSFWFTKNTRACSLMAIKRHHNLVFWVDW